MSLEADLAKELGPEPDYSGMTEEWIKSWKGMQLITEVNFRLSKSPVAFQQNQDLMERFFWDEGSVKEYQNGLRHIFTGQPELKAKFATFLEAPIETPAQQEEAKARLCEVVGIAGQMRRKQEFVSNMETKFFQAIKTRLGHVDVLEEYVDDTVFPGLRWKKDWTQESKDVFFTKLAEAIKDEPDLLERLETVWHGWGFENMD